MKYDDRKRKKEPRKMLKCIVRTTGSFGLLNTNGESIDPNRATLTLQTEFIEQRLHRGDLRVIARNLPKDANDEDFAKVLEATEGKDKDKDRIAAAAYAATLGVDVEGEPTDTETETPAQRKAREKKARDEEKKQKEDEEAEKKRQADEAAKLKDVPPLVDQTPPPAEEQTPPAEEKTGTEGDTNNNGEGQ